MKTSLGKLEKLNPRQAWRNEATEFTPWLAQEENLGLLADALGLSELSLVQTEHPIGDFNLDILCTDDQGEVIIENQLDSTDHKHLGQILTYAAGVEAKKVIWIADSFRTEHIAALEFLNHNTTSDLNFFAVEISLWKIGDSAMAPNFNVVVKPNDWSKTTRENARFASVSNPTKQQQLKFWGDWIDYLKTTKSFLKPRKPIPQPWSIISAGRTGFHFAAVINTKSDLLGAEVYIDIPESKELFAELLKQKDSIEEQLGFSMDWQELPNKRASRVIVTMADSPLSDEAKWSEYFEWLKVTLEKMDKVFRPIIRAL